MAISDTRHFSNQGVGIVEEPNEVVDSYVNDVDVQPRIVASGGWLIIYVHLNVEGCNVVCTCYYTATRGQHGSG